MRLRNFRRKAIGLSLSVTALAGVGLMSYAGDLPIHLADYTSSTSQVQLPAATDATANVPSGEIFGLCTAYLNHISGEATTSTTSPSSTTTSPSSTTTTSASTTTTSSSSSTTSTTGGSSTTSSSTTASDQDNLKVPLVLTNAAKAKGETVLELCTAVNPQHAKLKLFGAVKIDSDDTTTTTAAPTTTTTAPTTTTTAASSSSLKDDSHTNLSSSAQNDNSNTQQKSSEQSVFGSAHSRSSSNGSIGLNLNTHFDAHAKVSGNQG